MRSLGLFIIATRWKPNGAWEPEAICRFTSAKLIFDSFASDLADDYEVIMLSVNRHNPYCCEQDRFVSGPTYPQERRAS